MGKFEKNSVNFLVLRYVYDSNLSYSCGILFNYCNGVRVVKLILERRTTKIVVIVIGDERCLR